VSGSCDSIRERRTRESWEEWEEETTQTTVVTTATIGALAAQIFAKPDEAALAVEKLVLGKLSIEYLAWNGRTDVRLIGVC
jgi:hypothetical protein